MDKDEKKIKDLSDNLPPETMSILLASVAGITLEEQEENARIFEAAKQYRNLPIEQWPDFEIRWDLSPENRRFAFDSYDETTYRKYHPNGLIAGWVDFTEFNSKLAPHSQRTKEEIWSTGSAAKIAKTILYYVEKNRMTPPLICLDKDGISVMVGGGYNRIAVCLAKEVEKIPILVVSSEKKILETILQSVKWEDE